MQVTNNETCSLHACVYIQAHKIIPTRSRCFIYNHPKASLPPNPATWQTDMLLPCCPCLSCNFTTPAKCPLSKRENYQSLLFLTLRHTTQHQITASSRLIFAQRHNCSTCYS